MSLFLLPQDQYYLALNLPVSQEQIHNQLKKQEKKYQFLGDSKNKDSTALGQSTLNKIIYQKQQRHLLIIFKFSCKLKGSFSIKMGQKKQLYSLFVDILDENQNYYKVNNCFQVTQICRNFISQNAFQKHKVFFLKLDPSNRQVKIQLPFYFSQTWSQVLKLSQINIYERLFMFFIKPHLSLIQLSLKNILKQEARHSVNFMLQKQSKTIQLLKKYCSISHLSSHIYTQPQIDSRSLQKKLQTQKQNMNKILALKQTESTYFIKNNSLFIDLFMYQRGIVRDYELKEMIFHDQIKSKTKIVIPSPPQSNKPQDNYMIYNKIELKQIQKQSIKINKGGFADIYLTQISFWYSFLSDMRTPNPKTQKNLITEQIVIKRELPRNLSEEKESTFQSRRQHEQKILQKLKNGKSIYIPKYYFPINTKKSTNHIVDNFLLIQYIQFKTLDQLLQTNAKYLSLHTKLLLMYALCQGLRYLRDFDIVHLDIKPRNILTYYNSFVKLIDFGQSFHIDVCMKGYEPGFTIPYSPPQIFNNEYRTFTSKSDIFSMGVVFHEMLFNKFSFNFYQSTTQYSELIKNRLEQSWYYSPQEHESFGQAQVIRILINLISRCSSFISQNRPELDWIAVIIRYLLELVQ